MEVGKQERDAERTVGDTKSKHSGKGMFSGLMIDDWKFYFRLMYLHFMGIITLGVFYFRLGIYICGIICDRGRLLRTGEGFLFYFI